MWSAIRIHLVLFCLLLPNLVSLSFAQDQLYVRRNAAFDDQAVHALLQDPQNYRWAATDQGLHRYYSSNNITTDYKSDANNTSTISSDKATVLFSDQSEMLWVGTQNGLNKFDVKKESFKRYMSTDGDEHSLSDNHITAICQDNQGVIWVGTANGLNALYLESDRCDRYTKANSDLKDNHITALYVDRRGTLWIGTKTAGLMAFDTRLMAERPLNTVGNLPSDEITCLLEDTRGHLWVGTTKGLGAILTNAAVSSGQKWQIFREDAKNGLTDPHVTCIMQDNNRSFWVGTKAGGLNKIVFTDLNHLTRYQFLHFSHDAATSKSINSNSITALWCDNSNHIWIGTTKGLSKRDAKNETMTNSTQLFMSIVDPSKSQEEAKDSAEAADNTTSVSGYLMYSKLHPAGGVKVRLVNGDGQSVANGVTDGNGAFFFENLPSDQSYMLQVDNDDVALSDQAIVYLTNDNGEIIMKVKGGDSASFNFRTLSRDEVNGLQLLEGEDERLLSIQVYGHVYKELPGDIPEGMTVQILNEDGDILYTTTTLADGRFEFTELPPDRSYTFAIKELGDESITIEILNSEGDLVQKLFKNTQGYFTYERLSKDEVTLSLIDEEDMELIIRPADIFTAEHIYYDYNSSEINPIAAKELDKLAAILKNNRHLKVELSSHTDARGSESYNLELSQARVDAAVDYLVSTGVSREVIIGKGYGESKLLNSCADKSDCSERDHSKNRRTEFKFVK